MFILPMPVGPDPYSAVQMKAQFFSPVKMFCGFFFSNSEIDPFLIRIPGHIAARSYLGGNVVPQTL